VFCSRLVLEDGEEAFLPGSRCQVQVSIVLVTSLDWAQMYLLLLSCCCCCVLVTLLKFSMATQHFFPEDFVLVTSLYLDTKFLVPVSFAVAAAYAHLD